MARAETIALFQGMGRKMAPRDRLEPYPTRIERISDQVILLSHGYVVAEGQIQGVRSEVKEQPMQIVVRAIGPTILPRASSSKATSSKPKIAAGSLLFSCVRATPIASYLLLNRVIINSNLIVESVAPADDDVNAVYQYLIRRGRGHV